MGNDSKPIQAGRIAKPFDDGGEALSIYWDESREYTKGHVVLQQYQSDNEELRLKIDEAEWLLANLPRALAMHPLNTQEKPS